MRNSEKKEEQNMMRTDSVSLAVSCNINSAEAALKLLLYKNSIRTLEL